MRESSYSFPTNIFKMIVQFWKYQFSFNNSIIRLKQMKPNWAIFAVVPVLIITFLYNFPRFFERHYFIVYGTLESNKTEFSNRESYKYGYYLVASTVINSLIPKISLLFLNSSIVLTIKRSSKNLLAIDESSLENRRNKTNILFAVFICFFICHLPRVIYKSLY